MLGINQNIATANIPNLNTNLINSITAAQKQPIGLTQFKDLNMPQAFTDDNGTKWKLAKSSKDSSVEIPDPAMVTLTRWWNHVHPLSNGKVYIYVVEGIKRPRIESENSVMVLYQWFSTANRSNFTPNDITAAEWYNANVYTANIIDSRISQLRALCGMNQEQKINAPNNNTIEELDINLIRNTENDRRTDAEAAKTSGTHKK
jgi:hypothetical protein